MQQLSVEPVKVKSKNLNVLEEHRKAKRKKAANFVVIGLSHAQIVNLGYLINSLQVMSMPARAHLWEGFYTILKLLTSEH